MNDRVVSRYPHLLPRDLEALGGSGWPRAYMDNRGQIWVWYPDPPSPNGIWQMPTGVRSKANNRAMEVGLQKYGVKELRRMLPVRRERLGEAG